jgi:quercetin dioxygenase-like cupin family protein
MEDWELARIRESDDTGPEVRAQIAERGFVLFKLGGDFELIASELQTLESGEFELGTAPSLEEHPVHLGLGASMLREPPMTDEAWYEAYGARHEADGLEGRLLTMYTFARAWGSWEMHPKGSELVLCTAGEMTLVQELDGVETRTFLSAGRYAINQPGVWHTVDVVGSATAVFITSGVGTQHRPR